MLSIQLGGCCLFHEKESNYKKWDRRDNLASLDDDGDTLTTTDTGRADGVLALGALELMGQVGHNTGARGTERVSESNGTTVQVGLGAVQSENLLNSQVLGSKGLVDLDKVHILEGQTGLLEGTLDGRNWADTHDGGLDGGNVPGDNLGERLQSMLFDGLLGGDDDGTSTVRDTRGVSGGDSSLLLEDGGELDEGLDGGCGASMFIVAEGLDVLLDLVLDGDNLSVEATGLVGYFDIDRLIRVRVMNEGYGDDANHVFFFLPLWRTLFTFTG